MLEGISLFVEALVFLIFFLVQPGIPTPQLSGVTDSASPPQAIEVHDHEINMIDPVNSTHDSPSPPPRQAQSSGLVITALNNNVRDSSLPPLPRQNHGNDLNTADHNHGALSAPSSPSKSFPLGSEVYTSSPPSLHTESHNDIPNITSIASSSSPLLPETHSSPHVEIGGDRISKAHVVTPKKQKEKEKEKETGGDLHRNGPISESRTSSSSPPTEPHVIPATATGTSLLPGARDFVMNNPVINIQGDPNHDIVIQGEVHNTS